MQEWIEVDWDTYRKERKATIRGLEVELLVSPYDIPEAVRGYYDKDKDRFIVEFKYVGDEPRERNVYDKHVIYSLGESSRRLYGLEIDVKAMKAEAVEVRVGLLKQEVNEAMDNLLRITSSSLREDNYRLAKDAIIAKQQELFAAIA